MIFLDGGKQKKTRRLKALAVFTIIGISFNQIEAAAFNFVSLPVSQSSPLRQSLPVLSHFNQSLMHSLFSSPEKAEIEIPESVLAKFNPLASRAVSSLSKIYYDKKGRVILRHEVGDGSYFEVYRQTRGLEAGKVREYRLRDSSGDQHFRFYYYKQGRVPSVRIVYGENRYQGFEILPNGSLGRIIEIGQRLNRRFIQERVYDYRGKRLIFYNNSNVYERRVFEMKPDGQAGRPLEYRGRLRSGEMASMRFLYNDAERTVTCLQGRGMEFTVYELEDGKFLGKLLRFGTAASVSKNKIHARRLVEITEIKRGSSFVPVYVFSSESSAGYLIRERGVDENSGLGVMGRVLRFTNDAVDYEYFYENADRAEAPSIKVVNHKTGQTLKFELPRKLFREESGRVSRPAKNIFREIMDGGMSVKHGSQPSSKGFGLIETPQPIHSFYHEEKAEKTYLKRFLRGPPAQTLGFFEFSLPSKLLFFSSPSLFLVPFFALPFNTSFNDGGPR